MDHKHIKAKLLRLRRKMQRHVKKNDLPFPSDDLGGACGLCSYMAFRMLKEIGYNPILRMNNEHCFLTLGKYYIDLTLAQFFPNTGDLYFKDHPYRYEHNIVCVHQIKRSARTIQEARRLFRGWPPEQNPFRQRLPLTT